MLVDLATCGRGEGGDPRLVGVAVPQDEVQLALPCPDCGLGSRFRGRRLLERRTARRVARSAGRHRKHSGRDKASGPDPAGVGWSNLLSPPLLSRTYVCPAVQASLTGRPSTLAASLAASI